jgi:molybdenum cofactor guanylyltransferase
MPLVSGIVLAGGQSRRMGRDKALIELQGKPIIQYALDALASMCDERIVVANDTAIYARFGVPVVADLIPGKGSLGGIYSGLQAARGEYVIAVACDMPFLNGALLRFMLSLAPQYDVVLPQASSLSGKTQRGAGAKSRDKTTPLANQPLAKDRDLHPMHAIYSKKCLASMEEKLRMDDLRLIAFFDSVRVRILESSEVDRFDPEHWSLFNVNTPQDLDLASLQVQRSASENTSVPKYNSGSK